jgi:hypothetical protein
MLGTSEHVSLANWKRLERGSQARLPLQHTEQQSHARKLLCFYPVLPLAINPLMASHNRFYQAVLATRLKPLNTGVLRGGYDLRRLGRFRGLPVADPRGRSS